MRSWRASVTLRAQYQRKSPMTDDSAADQTRPRFIIDAAVCFPALILLFGAIAMVLTIPEKGSNPFAGLQTVIVDTASWFYVLIVTLIAVIVLYLALSRYGDIKLGPDHAEPAYSYISWFAMLFSAGIGIGMMFYGIAEPVMHFLAPPTGPGGTPAAATEACLLYTSPSPRDRSLSRMPSSA